MTEPTRPQRRTMSLTSGWQPVSPASNPWERVADRYLAGWEAVAGGYRILVLIAVVSLLGWLVPDRLAMLPIGMLVLAVGLGCAVGFVRCRTAHCVITGAGLTPVGLLMIIQVAVQASWLGYYVWLAVAVAIIVIGFSFQALWALTHHSTRIARRHRSQSR